MSPKPEGRICERRALENRRRRSAEAGGGDCNRPNQLRTRAVKLLSA